MVVEVVGFCGGAGWWWMMIWGWLGFLGFNGECGDKRIRNAFNHGWLVRVKVEVVLLLWRLRGMGGLGVLRSWIKMDRLIGLFKI